MHTYTCAYDNSNCHVRATNYILHKRCHFYFSNMFNTCMLINQCSIPMENRIITVAVHCCHSYQHFSSFDIHLIYRTLVIFIWILMKEFHLSIGNNVISKITGGIKLNVLKWISTNKNRIKNFNQKLDILYSRRDCICKINAYIVYWACREVGTY